MNYRDAISYIDSLSSRGWVFGLKGIKGILDRIGNPERSLTAIHVAGTNGKGSVSTMIHDILVKHGLRVGLYTSPHILSFRERIVVNGKKIGREELSELVSGIVASLNGHDTFTYFDFTTALAFKFFEEMEVDIAVVEVGLGGRLDSTNVVTPEVSVITRLSLDHTDVLGNSLDSIAKEKAGIIKEKVPLVFLKQEAVEDIIRSIAASKGSEAFSVGKGAGDIFVEGSPESLTYFGRNFTLPGIDVSGKGVFQEENVGISLAALDIMGFPLSGEKVLSAISSFKIPGRFEVINQGSWKFIFDVGHNPLCMKVLRESVKASFGEEKFLVVFGALKDKDVASMLCELLPITDELLSVPLPTERSMDAEKIANIAREKSMRARAFGDPESAVSEALKNSRNILFTGSFYTVMVTKKALWKLCEKYR